MVELLRNAGPVGALVVAAGVLGALVALAAIAVSLSPKTVRVSLVLAGVVLGLGAATLLLGVTGQVAGRMATFRALAHVSPEEREVIRQAGYAEAGANTTLGGLFGAPLLLVGAAVIGAAFARRGARS